jgi:hypothetical protein
VSVGVSEGPVSAWNSPRLPHADLIAGRQQPGSKRTRRRLARYRTGTEGRISYLKHAYGLRRSRLKGERAGRPLGDPHLQLDTLAVRRA